ncbi:MAG: type IV secretory system conjugative DNA transfer family protein [Corallococcus sp.]|nr:type IV secretory system conjugative DNA transfer family protein [Corallococcus sp.]MCM1395724.1 type IV secretory system conjugative DNA transfer family protein [Corallococcus sp.]
MSTKKKILIAILLCVVSPIVVCGAVLLIYVLLFKVPFENAIADYKLYLISIGIIALLLLAVLFDYRIRGSKRVLKVNADLENSHWMTQKEMIKNKGFSITTFNELGEVSDGIPIRAEVKRDKLHITLIKSIHALIIGATRSGKTTSFVSPTIEILGHTKTKPSMVITDPKGELCAQHSANLERLGYKVSIINLDDIFHSSRWNPFNEVLKKTKELRGLKVTHKNGRYYVAGKEYQTKREADERINELRPQIENDIYLDLQELVYAMCTIDSKNDPSWQIAARDFIFGMVLALWEDVRDGLMPMEKFTLYNLYKCISEYATSDCEVLRQYVSTRSSNSRVKGLTNTVLVSQDRTLASYLGEVNRYITWLADEGIDALTSGNDVDFSNFDEEPNALFVIIPETRTTRYTLVTLFVQQMYKLLVDKATDNREQGKSDGQELLRNVYFIMDEFGNLPKLYMMDRIVTVGAGRKIFMLPVIQSFSQLENIYGKSVSDTIRGNCNIQIFIGSNDKHTRELFSEMCGKKKVKQVNYSENKDMSVSTSAHSVPLIYPIELENLNDTANGKFGNMIVHSLNNYPIKSKIAPFFQTTEIYGVVKGDIKRMEFIRFDAAKMLYDVAITTAYLLGDKLYEPIDDGEEAPTYKKDGSGVGVKKETKVVAQSVTFWKTLRQKIKKLQSSLSAVDYQTLLQSDDVATVSALLKRIRESSDNQFLSVEIIKIEKYIEKGATK